MARKRKQGPPRVSRLAALQKAAHRAEVQALKAKHRAAVAGLKSELGASVKELEASMRDEVRRVQSMASATVAAHRAAVKAPLTGRLSAAWERKHEASPKSSKPRRKAAKKTGKKPVNVAALLAAAKRK